MERRSRHGSRPRAWLAGGREMAMRLVMATSLLLPHMAAATDMAERPGCFIRLSRAGQVMHLTAFVESAYPLMGSYQFRVGKQGTSGHSYNTQRGAFQASAPDGSAVLLGRASVRLVGDDNLRADLTVFAGRDIICRAVL